MSLNRTHRRGESPDVTPDSLEPTFLNLKQISLFFLRSIQGFIVCFDTSDQLPVLFFRNDPVPG